MDKIRALIEYPFPLVDTNILFAFFLIFNANVAADVLDAIRSISKTYFHAPNRTYAGTTNPRP